MTSVSFSKKILVDKSCKLYIFSLHSYMYCDIVDITPDNIVNLAYLSDKYLIHTLKDQCIQQFCKRILCRENAVRFAGLYKVDKYVIPEIRNATMAYIQAFASKIFEKDIEYDELSRDTLRQLLENDFLNCEEYELYAVCYGWAEHQCKGHGQPVQPKDIAEHLGDLLQLIRFPTMSSTEFAIVSKHGVLNSEDEQKLLEYISQKDIPEQRKNTSQKPMQDKTNRMDTIRSVGDVPFNCVRRSHYGKFENDKHDGDDYWISYSIDIKKGIESSLCNIFAVKSHKECKKGCLVLSVETPVSLLAFRLQLDELVCHRYSEEGFAMKVIITRKSCYGRVRSRYIGTVDVGPTASPVNRFHYHEARFRKPVTLRARRRYEIVLECTGNNTLYYHELPHDYFTGPSADFGRPFWVRWNSTKMACKSNGCVPNLIHGINYYPKTNMIFPSHPGVKYLSNW